MTAVDQFKRRARTASEQEDIRCRIALEQSITDEIRADLLAEARIDYADDGRTATLSFAGHLPIHVVQQVDRNGMPAGLLFSVRDVDRHHWLAMTPQIDEAIEKAENPGPPVSPAPSTAARRR